IYFGISAFLVHIPLTGIASKYMWPGSIFLEERVLLINLPLMVASGAFFIAMYLKLDRTNILLARVCWTICIVELLLTFLSIFMPLRIILPVNLASLLIGFSSFVILYKEVRTQMLSSMYFIIGWLCITTCGIVVILEHWALINSNLFTQNATFYALTFDYLLLSVALNDSLNQMVGEQMLVREALSGKFSKDNFSEDWKKAVGYLTEPSEKEVTMMFVDVVGFSSLSERLPGVRAFALLKECMNEISTIINEYGGVIDRSLGDGIFCFFGYNSSRDTSAVHARKAFDAAKKIQYESAMKAAAGVTEAVFPLRIGINTDSVYIGNIGGEGKIDFTMIGNGVILASRLEAACNPFKIMISENTFEKLGISARDSGLFNPIKVKIKHHDELQGAYEYDVFHDNARIVEYAQDAYFQFLGYRLSEEREEVDFEDKLMIYCTFGVFYVRDFSPSGFRVYGTTFLGRTVEFDAYLDSSDGRLAGRLKEKNLHIFRVEVRWSRSSGDEFEHGLKITSLNKAQISFIHEAITENISKGAAGNSLSKAS
ncbi:MAG: adenylate/guanylate cyclase domain-containing protein, partial [Oligoflexales bacterium]|nr:adenylate/guanylate cyclase domain-containing protein [Oligoflexales bacterium]